MSNQLKSACDAVLARVTTGTPRVPGVVAMATDRNGNIYEGAAGMRSLADHTPMTTESVFAIFSTTKAIAGTAALQLVEDGSLDLDAPAKHYVPAIGELQILEGFADDGTPRLRTPKQDITTRMLLLHTAGLGYNFFNESYNRMVQSGQLASIVTGSKASLNGPLLFEPGTRWEYGCNIDWVGQVVEAISGKRLGAVMQERIFAPLGMTSTSFALTPDMRSRLARIHQRGEDGSLTATDFELPPDPEVHMGGHGLYGTVGDYMRFIRMWLNDGMGEHGRVLKAETVAMAARNGLGDMKIKKLPGVVAALTHDAEFFPGMPKSWGLSFMINDQPAPTGRPAGALAWAGLANCYYWIDRASGVGGYWATQIFPFADPTSVGGYLDFETAVYAASAARAAA